MLVVAWITGTLSLWMYSIGRLIHVFMVLWLTFLSFPLSFHRCSLSESIFILTSILFLDLLVFLVSTEIRFTFIRLILKVHLLRNSRFVDRR